jgi:hypothetical protein
METYNFTKKASRVIWLALLLLGIGPTAQSQIVMTIDTINETFSFDGTDSGTGVAIQWRDFSVAAYSGDSDTDRLDFSGGFSGGATNSFIRFTAAEAFVGTAVIGGGTKTLTGTGTSIGYTATSDAFKSSMSGLLERGSLASFLGSGFSSITVVAPSAVPEPGSYAAILASFTLAGVLIRRPRRTRPARSPSA